MLPLIRKMISIISRIRYMQLVKVGSMKHTKKSNVATHATKFVQEKAAGRPEMRAFSAE